MDSEDIIIRKAAQGNEQAFRILVEKYESSIFKICLSVINDRDHAENIAQETFLQIYRNLSSYEYKGFKTWIGRIALNKAIDYKRKLDLIKKREVSLTDEFQNTLTGEEKGAIDHLLSEEYRKSILALCETLPEKHKNIINKYYIEEKSYSEIALEENISVRTVESRLYRSRKLLKEKWEEEYK